MTHRPCSHIHEKFAITGDKELPFAQDGIVRWYLNNYCLDLSCDEQRAIFNHAFQDWNQHFHPLRFEEAENRKDAYIQIWFTGVKRTILAQMVIDFFPRLYRFFSIEPYPMDEYDLGYGFGAFSNSPHSGHLFINSKYNWRTGKYNLKLVATHEIGHIANIGHSEFEDEIMYDYYHEGARITQDTINAIEHKYGYLKAQYNDIKSIARNHQSSGPEASNGKATAGQVHIRP